METDSRDYLYCAGLIAFVMTATASLLVIAEGRLASVLGAYTPVAMLVLMLLAYGGFTALVLAVVSAWFPLIEGDYAMDHPQFTCWKVQHVVGELGKAALLIFFPVFARQAFYVLFGARIGKQVAVAGKILDPRLTVLEDCSVLGEGSIVTSHTIVQGRFILRAVHVCRGATVGVGCVLMPGVRVGEGAVLLPGAVLKAGTQVPAGETWGGVPGVRIRPAAG